MSVLSNALCHSIPDRYHRHNKTSHISEDPCSSHLTFGKSGSYATGRDNHLAVRARNQVLTAVFMKMPCRLADGYRRFEGACCFLRQGQAVQGDSFETSEDYNIFSTGRLIVLLSVRPIAHSFSRLLYSHVPYVLFIFFFLSLVLSYSPLKDSIHIVSIAGFHSWSLC
jgi:hypothetical protein